MAAAPANSADATKAEAFIGSLISLITKYAIRYEGFLFQLSPQESTIGLRNVRSFGTEGRRMDGTHVAPSDRIYEYICFRGSDIKDLRVISSPPIESTPTVPDDPAIIQPSSSGYLKAGNSGTNVILPSALILPPSYSENVDESAMQLPKSPARKLPQGASSYRHVSRHYGLIRGDVMHGGMFYPHQGYRGPAQGRGRGILPNGAAPQYYPTYRGRPVGRGSGMIGPATYPRHIARGRPKNFTPHHRYSVGTPAWGGNQAEIDFSEDFDFEAMNEKFNKEEVWDLLGKKDQKAGPEDENEGGGGEEDETVEPMVKHQPSYSKEDFFDSISCGALEAELAKDKKNSEARNAHAETFGEIQGVPQPDHGTLRPPRGGASRDTYRRKGYDRGEAVWSRVA